MDDQTFWLSIAGIAGTFLAGAGSPFLQQFVVTRGAKKSRFFEERIALYLDAMQYAQFERRWLRNSLRDETDRYRMLPYDGPSYIELAPRVELLAEKRVRAAWTALRDARDELQEWIAENNYNDDQYAQVMLREDRAVAAVRDALETFIEALRKDIGS